jgi:hypothetical protein
VVQRARLLLICAGISACKAQSLGVEVPTGGIESISVEDLQRDTWMFTNDLDDRAHGGENEEMAAERLKQRLQEMRTLPAFGRAYKSRKSSGPWKTCGIKEGAASGAQIWMAMDSGDGAVGGAVPRAVLISLAKAFDTYEEPPRPQVFCALSQTGGLEDYLASPAYPLAQTSLIVSFGPMGSGPLTRAESEHQGIPRLHFSTSEALLGTDGDQMEAVDYREVMKHVVTLFGTAPEGSSP